MLRSGFCDEASRIAAGRCFAKPAQHDKFLSSAFCEAIPNVQEGDCFVAQTAPRNDIRKKGATLIPHRKPLACGWRVRLVSLVFAISASIYAFIPIPAEAACSNGAGEDAGVRGRDTITYTVFLPTIGKYPQCTSIPGETYNTVAVISAPANPAAEVHPDLNLAMRGYVSTTVSLGFVDLIGPPSDLDAPQLAGLFADNRAPIFNAVYRVNNWGWDCNLLNLYYQMNRAGRSRLPALYVGQGVGRAITNEIDVAIRDTGAFLDPRSRLDWWQGQ